MGVRITGGEFRGRVLQAPTGTHVRPTGDRNRQAIFNMLNAPRWLDDLMPGTDFDLDGAVVLDGFAGTGALGVEALSRGAAYAVFFEKDRAVAGLCRNNLESLKITDRTSLYVRDSTKPGARPADVPPATLVFLDPPYRQGLVPRALGPLVAGGWMAPGAIAVLETENTAPADELVQSVSGVRILDERAYGLTLFRFVQYCG